MRALKTPPDEFSDFEQASLPRYHVWTVPRLVRLFGVVLLVQVLIVGFVISALAYYANSPENRVLGIWTSNAHPEWKEIRVLTPSHISATTHDGNTIVIGEWHFRARSTLEVVWQGGAKTGLYKLRFDGADLLIDDVNEGTTYRWKRR